MNAGLGRGFSALLPSPAEVSANRKADYEEFRRLSDAYAGAMSALREIADTNRIRRGLRLSPVTAAEMERAAHQVVAAREAIYQWARPQ